MRILVIDDHVIVRKGVCSIIKEEIAHAQVGEAGSANEGLARCKAQRWDIVIMDLNLPGRNGFELMQELHQLQPRLPVLVLSIHTERQYALQALKLGAAGYLSKDTLAQELVTAVRRLAQGGKYLTESLVDALALEYQHGASDKLPHELLSQREYAIFLLIAAGHTVSEIAAQLARSVKTISTQRGRVLEKMNLNTNAELTRYAFEHGLMDTLK